MIYYKYSLKMLASIGFTFLVGCSDSSIVSEDNNLIILESNLTRNLAPSSSETELQNIADNNNRFAFSMFSKIYAEENSSIFFSPYSISEAMAIAYAGANGDTKDEIASVFNFDIENNDEMHNSFNALNLHLSASDNNYTFEVTNAFWVQNDYSILDSYLNTIKVNYGANIKVLDFINQTEASRVSINDWVKEKTYDKIEEIIPINELKDSTKVVMTNTVYFQGEWQTKFYDSYTKEDAFIAEDGSTKQVSFMNQYGSNYKYISVDSYQAVELPYKDTETSMLIILPDDGELANVVENIETVYQNIGNMNYENINLKMPKFEFNSDLYDIKEYLEKLGMISPFSNEADFSNMTGDYSLKIDTISHKAFLKVDENGTEATAATAIVDVNVSSGVNSIDINRAFIIFIKDDLSKQILFMGVIESI